MKSSNLWRIIWIVGIYVLLGLILYLVIVYKVQWEDKDLNTYLYLYDCNHNLCTSRNNQEDYYNKILCEDDICPDIMDVIDNMVILKNNNISWLYNYIDDNIVSDKYTSYKYIGNDMYVVSDNAGKYGIINELEEIIVPIKFNHIDNYNGAYISVINNDAYGIIKADGLFEIKSIYQDVVLINDKIFAGMNNNKYYMYSYNNINRINDNEYDFVYANSDVVLVIKNKKIDILDSNLNSMLLMKLDTFYDYTTEKERDSLDIYSDEKFIYFKVYISETEYKMYQYAIKDKKIF